MRKYRKYLEPEYGEASPEVRIGAPQQMDLAHLEAWRIRTNYETTAAIIFELSRCNRYEVLMEVRTEDAEINRGNAVIPLRIYYPDSGKKVPVMLFCHGGAFSMNNLDVYDPVCRYLSRFGKMLVVSVDYRLAPEHPYPAGLSDCYHVLEWTAAQAERLGADPGKVVVCGDSSGGNFAAVLAMMARDRKGPSIHKQVLIYPVTALTQEQPTESELRYGRGYFLEYGRIEKLGGYYLTKQSEYMDPYVSPLYAENLKGLPAAGFFSAECDPLLDQGLMYAARLQDAGVMVDYHIYKGMIHAFLNAAYGKTFEMLDDICRFVNGAE